MEIASGTSGGTGLSDAKDFRVIKKLGQSKAEVYLIYVPNKQKFYAMKVFSFDKKNADKSYMNEARFCSLYHPNIISYTHAKDYQRYCKDDKLSEAALIFMELAPYGNIVSVFRQTNLFQDEVIVRTYFKQLVSGLDYLHSRDVYHLDLKPENLLLGENYKLKIADFDCAYRPSDHTIRSRGTKNYRAPELTNENNREYKKADIYSAGIILFVLRTGFHPYLEGKSVSGYDLEKLMESDPDAFWRVHQRLHQSFPQLDSGFKELFMQMVRADPSKRASLEEVKKNSWLTKGKIYQDGQLNEIVSKLNIKSHC